MSMWAFNCGTTPKWGTQTQTTLHSSNSSYSEVWYTKYLNFLVKLGSTVSRIKKYWSLKCSLKVPLAPHEPQWVIIKILTLNDHTLGKNWKFLKLTLPFPWGGGPLVAWILHHMMTVRNWPREEKICPHISTKTQPSPAKTMSSLPSKEEMANHMQSAACHPILKSLKGEQWISQSSPSQTSMGRRELPPIWGVSQQEMGAS